MGAGLAGWIVGSLAGRKLDEYEVFTVVHIAPSPTVDVPTP